MPLQPSSSILRILDPGGHVVGTGFLVTNELAVTCSHVITQCLGLLIDPEIAPKDTIRFDFPLIKDTPKITGQVIVWQPRQADGSGDLAVLHVLDPLPLQAEPAPVVDTHNLWGHKFHAFGFPSGFDNGVWSSGRILAQEGTGWLQIEDDKQTGVFVQPGFSGGPIWDEEHDGVVGMVVASAIRNDQKTAFALPWEAIYQALLSIDQPFGPSQDQVRIRPENEPYKGLQYFDIADADKFFGRDEVIKRLVQHVEEHPFLAIVGASGSGKSSVLRAGFVPRLIQLYPIENKETGSTVELIHVFTPTAHPLESLAIHLTKHSESVKATATLFEDMTRAARSLDIYIKKQLACGDTRENQALTIKQLVIIVDQFEEVFTLCHNPQERKQFLDNLLTAGGIFDAARDKSGTLEDQSCGSAKIVIALRADFYHYCSEYDNLRSSLEKFQIYIGAMSPAELRQAIEEPARSGGWDIEPGLVDLLLREIGQEPGALPLLSHSLRETWKRRRGRMLTLSGYEETGGVHGAIAQTADSVYQKLPTDRQAIVKDIFLRLTEPVEGTLNTRHKATFDELILFPQARNDVEIVIRTLSDARLLTTTQGYVEVAHEALIREWPTLQVWLDEDREGLIVHHRLTEATHEWLRMNRDPGALYRGKRLDQAKDWAEVHNKKLSALEKEFLSASLEVIEAEDLERKQQRQRELDLEKRGDSDRRRFFWLMIILSLIVISGFVFLINTLVVDSERERFNNSLLEASRVANDGIVNYEKSQLEGLRFLIFTEGMAQAMFDENTEQILTSLRPILANSRVNLISALDTDGQEIVTFGREPNAQEYRRQEDTDFSGIEAVSNILNGKVDVQGDKYAQLIKLEQGPILFTSGPVRDANEQLVGVMMVGTYLQDILDDLRKQSLADNIVLVDAKSELIGSTYLVEPEGFGSLVTLAKALNPAEKTRSQKVILNRRNYEIAYSPLTIRSQQVGWIGVVKNSDYMISDSAQSRNGVALFGSVMIAILFSLGFVIIYKPSLKKLTEKQKARWFFKGTMLMFLSAITLLCIGQSALFFIPGESGRDTISLLSANYRPWQYGNFAPLKINEEAFLADIAEEEGTVVVGDFWIPPTSTAGAIAQPSGTPTPQVPEASNKPGIPKARTPTPTDFVSAAATRSGSTSTRVPSSRSVASGPEFVATIPPGLKPGDSFTIEVRGFPAYVELQVGIGIVGKMPAKVKTGLSDKSGAYQTIITIPNNATAGEKWTVTIRAATTPQKKVTAVPFEIAK